MDINIKRKKTLPIKRYLLISCALLLVAVAVYHLWYLAQAEASIDGSTLVFDEVKRGQFTVSVRGTGLLVPDNVQWLSANVEGTVIRRVVKPGHPVNKGDLIVELSNPRLIQQLAETQWELEAMEAELSATRVAQESELQQQKSNVLNARLDFENSQLEFNARAELIKTGAVSKLDYDRARLTMNQSEQRLQANRNQLAKMEQVLIAQGNAQTARLNQTRKRVEIIQQQVDDLLVRATMDSIVLEMPLLLGQRLVMGDSIAKLAQQDVLIAELRIPELQIREVTIGQRVIVDTRNNKIEGVISRIDPAVINGSVQVDVELLGDMPDDARPDLSVDGEIRIAEIADALYVNRPIFAQSQSQTVLFKLSADGNFSERVDVRTGHGSINQIQIVEGLQAGDKVVISDPTRFEHHQKFRIN